MNSEAAMTDYPAQPDSLDDQDDTPDPIDSLFPVSPYPPDPRNTLYSWRDLYPTLLRVPHRFSHSAFELFHSCERKYDLLKNRHIGSTLDSEPDSNRNNVHLDFGTALGAGIQELLLHDNLDQAIWVAMRNYYYANETSNKNEIAIVNALIALQATWDPDEWEVVANELSFKVVLDPATQDYYCGYVDAVLRNRHTGVYAITEVKTTGYKMENLEPMYSNSPQGIGYSLVLDQIVKQLGGVASWTILYIVVQLKSKHPIPTLHLYPFEKQKKDKLEWLLTLQLDYQRILQYTELQFWPKRGSKCFTFNRACPLYGICGLPIEGHEGNEMIKKEDDWSYVFELSDLIQQQMERE